MLKTLLTRSVASSLSLVGGLALVVLLGTIGAWASAIYVAQARTDLQERVGDQAAAVADAIDSIDMTSAALVARVFPVFRAMVGNELHLDATGRQLLSGEQPLDGSTAAVDAFTAQTGGVATIFAARDGGFLRVATSLRKEDGSRALGTMLDPASAPYAAVSAGQPYSGRAKLFGHSYVTRYEPVKDAGGRIVAVLFIGFDIGVLDGSIEELVKRTRLFDTGGLYIVSGAADAAHASFALHPSAGGQRLASVVPDAGTFLQSLGDARGSAVPSPAVLSPGAPAAPRWAVMRACRQSGWWVVAEVNDDEAMAQPHRKVVLLWAFLAGTVGALAAGLWWLSRRLIGRPLAELARSARAVAAGDLAQSCASQRPDDVGQLMRDVEAMRCSFVALLTDVRTSADSIATASQQIAGGNSDLSARTESAASSLQETASSVEQLAAAVRTTADSARGASEMATQAASSAEQGSVLMQRVVQTMSTVQEGARRVSDISSVIDGIAFQTNILALNAAVEAARAGEAGRGFAVVASEVRSLAQRSASSAREIKSLIGSSVEQVAGASQLVAEVEATIVEMVARVKQVDALIAQISDQASGQAAGVGQVSQTVAQLDIATQQNAALVEEAAAATGSLMEQAKVLAASMQRFRLAAA